MTAFVYDCLVTRGVNPEIAGYLVTSILVALAIVPEFDLKVFQSPAGSDFSTKKCQA